MSARPRLLFLCQTLPYPPDGGVWIRTYHVLRLLSRAFDITALCFERTPMGGADPARLTETGVEALRRFADVEVFAIPQRHSRTRFVWDHLRSVARHRVYTTYRYESQPFEARLREILRSRDIDLIHVDSLDLVRHLPACGDRPVVCVHHDVTSMQLARRAGIENAEWRRAYLRHQARLTEQSEREWCGRVALNVAVSADDAAALTRISPSARVAIVPNGVDVEEFRPDGSAGRGAAYVGGLHWFPNADALQYFAADILPHLRETQPDLPVAWIGSATDEQRRAHADQFGIDVTGYLDDVRPRMRDAACRRPSAVKVSTQSTARTSSSGTIHRRSRRPS
jgi:glycosyltransferase involved in cell wall biosynthesis